MMTSIVIQIKDNRAIKILQSLKDTDLISFVDENENNIHQELSDLKPKNALKDESIFDLTGIWKDRDISITQIREKAWPKRK